MEQTGPDLTDFGRAERCHRVRPTIPDPAPQVYARKPRRSGPICHPLGLRPAVGRWDLRTGDGRLFGGERGRGASRAAVGGAGAVMPCGGSSAGPRNRRWSPPAEVPARAARRPQLSSYRQSSTRRTTVVGGWWNEARPLRKKIGQEQKNPASHRWGSPPIPSSRGWEDCWQFHQGHGAAGISADRLPFVGEG